ncbi:MAG: dihydrolipoyl dehydrogenase [Candidatus Nanohalobium sp.]
MVVGDITTGTDLVVIGAGPGGYNAAIRAAQKGLDVVVVEKDTIGGVCLNRGCIPAKALIHAAGVLEEIESWEKNGVHVENTSVDLEEVQDWKNNIVDKLDNGLLTIFDHYGIEYIQGEARFLDSSTVRVEEEHNAENIEFEKAVIATGSAPVEIPGLEFEKDGVISSRELLNMDEAPEELVVVGGGYIGMEAATKFSNFGSTVKIVEARDRILKMFDSEIVNELQNANSTYSKNIHTNAKAEEIEYEDGKPVLIADQEGEKLRIKGDKILVAAGRETRPNLESLSLENTGVEIDDRGFVKTDEKMKTDDDSIFCVGDAAGQPLLAHKAFREGKVAAEVAAGEPAAFDNQAIPSVMYTDPEVATVGLSEEEANERFDGVKTGRFPMTASGRALTTGNSSGFVKVVADGEGKLQGVQIIAARASDMIAEATLALEMQAYLDDIANTIHAHPTFGEALGEAAEDAMDESIHKI